jgi:hypothetical protein
LVLQEHRLLVPLEQLVLLLSVLLALQVLLLLELLLSVLLALQVHRLLELPAQELRPWLVQPVPVLFLHTVAVLEHLQPCRQPMGSAQPLEHVHHCSLSELGCSTQEPSYSNCCHRMTEA